MHKKTIITNCIVYGITLLISASPLAAVKDRFNNDYVNSQYYFVGNLLIKSEKNDTVYTTNSKMFPLQVKGSKTIFALNQNINILETIFSKGIWLDITNGQPGPGFKLPTPFNFDSKRKPENMVMVLFPFSEQYPTIVITQKDSLLLVLIGKPNQNLNGSKLTFNVSTFEKRMRNTHWYDNLNKKDRRIAFGLGVDADKANFLTEDQAFPISIMEITKHSQLDYPGLNTKYIRAFEPIVSKTRLPSYNELYKDPNPIISVTKMDPNDYKLFNELVKSNK